LAAALWPLSSSGGGRCRTCSHQNGRRSSRCARFTHRGAWACAAVGRCVLLRAGRGWPCRGPGDRRARGGDLGIAPCRGARGAGFHDVHSAFRCTNPRVSQGVPAESCPSRASSSPPVAGECSSARASGPVPRERSVRKSAVPRCAIPKKRKCAGQKPGRSNIIDSFLRASNVRAKFVINMACCFQTTASDE
jgi:hypothetical protein